MMENTPLVKMTNIKKYFGSVEALKDVNLEIGQNEVVGLLGDNGAGKSTLISILTGVYKPDEGEIYWRGEKLSKFTVSRARGIGIETVFQGRALCEQHSIWRNIFMGREIKNKLGFINVKKQCEETEKLMRDIMGFTSKVINTDSVVGFMSGGERQGIAISRALYFSSKLIILDEPATGLSLTETQKVLSFIKQIKNSGKSAIFISQNIYQAYPVVDKIVILDRGQIVFACKKSEISLQGLIDKMIDVAGGEGGEHGGKEIPSGDEVGTEMP